MYGHVIRRQFMGQFKNLDVNTRTTSTVIVVSYVLQALSAIVLGYWLLQPPTTLLTGLGLAAAMFFIGTRLRAINNIVHECSHSTFTQRREDNILFGRICSSLLLGTFTSYKEEHMSHHAYCGDYEKDLDLQESRAFRLEEPLSPQAILRHALTPIFGLHFRRLPNVSLSARDGQFYRATKIGLIAAAVVFLVLDPLAALLLVWVPFLWVYTAINYWTECIDHAGLVGQEDDLEASRNFIVPKQISPLIFPRNDCYHLVHHLFPQVPSQHLVACHKKLLTDPRYRMRVEGSHVPAEVD